MLVTKMLLRILLIDHLEIRMIFLISVFRTCKQIFVGDA